MNHHKVSIESVARVVMALGLDGFKKLSSHMPACSVKYAGFTIGEVEAILNILGEANIKRMLAGDVTIEIKELIQKMVDKNGRFIPLVGSKNYDCNPKPDYKLIQPDINYAERFNKAAKFLHNAIFVSAEEYQKRSEKLIEQLQNDPMFSNLLNGVWLPVCYPEFRVSDYKKDLFGYFLNAVTASYALQIPGRYFNNYIKVVFPGKIKIVDESHERFIAKMAKGPLVGLQFFPFQGFSINAVRELMSILPKSMYLSGPIDFAVAMTIHPDILARDYFTPCYDCSAVSWDSSYSTYFVATQESLRFDCALGFGNAHSHSTSSLIYLG
ncbi:MAG: hypothetical protein US83_C0001G0090 [Candidatus Falkowbacteria bacterium GW2011_GWC2_38_22]|uniref:Uncharacterized protein n=1 Tax=Candidatus Falkowbacteria bacterium GW2011_GWE1_38_31 TaxID=1618638 RepID=A0A0G0N1I0_9BACT|nr:MAG: hypothetical protein US73_C0004G0038 [Candidatus Falkowbacteria bacterium GW2011_GWF2_38_1205]KKQ62156.1 MAG: hypothetical protein US83_C0001G0090 [Candidatus Falkowbacteria bacterium GW2011_GWC2_38_22]KKQ64306.1 MAG: hypothetical protein US84_C0001G0090 [Candidatus Falkowbacteria bacterium GW2011_GWF1_38_22]KKQ66283.1 MAG: hypothetical protein US87_C0002G0090 [Candidatus Falkowbacteria bacterium GW2011_GWE2_38_254]KKQ71011.1 MAG: hypothetical protein US91_C0002G0090 [Candidatus Falkowb